MFSIGPKTMRSGKRLKILTLLTMLIYILCGSSLVFSSQSPSFACAAIASDTHYLSKRNVISSEEELSKDGKFKLADPAYTISQYIYPNNKRDSFHELVAVFLKQITLLHFSSRSPPVFSS